MIVKLRKSINNTEVPKSGFKQSSEDSSELKNKGTINKHIRK